jgi:hypothetical protein
MAVRGILLSAVLMALGACSSGWARSAAEAALMKTQNETDARFVRLYRAKDYAGLAKLMRQGTTRDFLVHEPGRKSFDLNWWLSERKAERETMTPLKTLDIHCADVKIMGDKAVVTTAVHFEFTSKDPKGKPHQYVIHGIYHENMVKAGKEWKARSLDTVSVKGTLDGKPYNATKHRLSYQQITASMRRARMSNRRKKK